MRLFGIVLASALVMSAGEAGAQAAAKSVFAPLEFAVGSCWTGPFPDGKAVDEHCFEWVYDKKFIRDRHVVRGGAAEYAGETLYAWNPATKQVTFTYWSSNGTVGTGTMSETPEGLVFLQSYSISNGALEFKSLWKQTGADGYHTTVSQRDGAEWKQLWVVPFTRKR